MGNKVSRRKSSMPTPDLSAMKEVRSQEDMNDMPVKNYPVSAEYELGTTITVVEEAELRMGVHRETGERRALKILKKIDYNERELKSILLRYRIHFKIDHPSIIKLIEVFNDNKYLTSVTEFVEGGSLFDVIHQSKKYSEREAANIMRQLLEAVAYLHANRIVHRSLKLEGIMYNERTAKIKLVELDICAVFKPGKPMTSCRGAPFYMAPETIRESYDEKVDVWACGVILYTLITGRPPFSAINDEEVLVKISAGKYDLSAPEFDSFSPFAKDMTRQLLTFDPLARPSAADAARHAWFDQALSTDPIPLNPIRSAYVVREESQIAREVFKFFVENIVAASEKEALRGIFHEFNRSGTGFLTKHELRDAMRSEAPVLTTGDAEHVFTRMQQLGRPIDFGEFLTAVLYRKKLITESNIKRCYELLRRGKEEEEPVPVEDVRKLVFPHVDDAFWAHFLEVIGKAEGDSLSFYELRHMLKEFIPKVEKLG